MKLFQVNFAQKAPVYVIADSLEAALDAARTAHEGELVMIAVMAAVGHNLVVQTGYALRPALPVN